MNVRSGGNEVDSPSVKWRDVEPQRLANVVRASVPALFVELQRNPRTGDEGRVLDPHNSTKGAVVAYLARELDAAIRTRSCPYALATSTELLAAARARSGGGKKPTDTGAIRKLFSQELKDPPEWSATSGNASVAWSFVTPESTQADARLPEHERNGKFGVIVAVRDADGTYLRAAGDGAGDRPKTPRAKKRRDEAKERLAHRVGRAATAAILDGSVDAATAESFLKKKRFSFEIRKVGSVVTVVMVAACAAGYAIYRLRAPMFRTIPPDPPAHVREADPPFARTSIRNEGDEGTLEFRHRGANTLLTYVATRIDIESPSETPYYQWTVENTTGERRTIITKTPELLYLGTTSRAWVDTFTQLDVRATWSVRKGKIAVTGADGVPVTPYVDEVQADDATVRVERAAEQSGADSGAFVTTVAAEPPGRGLDLSAQTSQQGVLAVEIEGEADLPQEEGLVWRRCIVRLTSNRCEAQTVASRNLASLAPPTGRIGEPVGAQTPTMIGGQEVVQIEWSVLLGSKTVHTARGLKPLSFVPREPGTYTIRAVLIGRPRTVDPQPAVTHEFWPLRAYHAAVHVPPSPDN